MLVLLFYIYVEIVLPCSFQLVILNIKTSLFLVLYYYHFIVYLPDHSNNFIPVH